MRSIKYLKKIIDLLKEELQIIFQSWMKSQLPNLSAPYLPKITSHYLEQLIK
jgi:hypothetical protein